MATLEQMEREAQEMREKAGLLFDKKVEIQNEKQRQLDELRSILPRKIVAWATGEIAREEVDRIKALIRQAESIIEDLPIVQQASEAMQRQAARKAQLLNRHKEASEHYRKILDDTIKAARGRNAEEIGSSTAEELRAYAAKLGPEAVAEVERVIKENHEAAAERRQKRLMDSGQAFRQRIEAVDRGFEPDEAA